MLCIGSAATISTEENFFSVAECINNHVADSIQLCNYRFIVEELLFYSNGIKNNLFDLFAHAANVNEKEKLQALSY